MKSSGAAARSSPLCLCRRIAKKADQKRRVLKSPDLNRKKLKTQRKPVLYLKRKNPKRQEPDLKRKTLKSLILQQSKRRRTPKIMLPAGRKKKRVLTMKSPKKTQTLRSLPRHRRNTRTFFCAMPEWRRRSPEACVSSETEITTVSSPRRPAGSLPW